MIGATVDQILDICTFCLCVPICSRAAHQLTNLFGRVVGASHRCGALCVSNFPFLGLDGGTNSVVMSSDACMTGWERAEAFWPRQVVHSVRHTSERSRFRRCEGPNARDHAFQTAFLEVVNLHAKYCKDAPDELWIEGPKFSEVPDQYLRPRLSKPCTHSWMGLRCRRVFFVMPDVLGSMLEPRYGNGVFADPDLSPINWEQNPPSRVAHQGGCPRSIAWKQCCAS